MDRVPGLLDGWRQLAAWRHDWTASPGPRKWNTLVGRLNRIAEEAAAEALTPGGPGGWRQRSPCATRAP
jgi:hypothetical protein